MHFDFRLEIDGVLKSWSIPRGPSLDPTVRRLAVQVEDHPLSYASFDGTIPEGQYGAGRSLIWDEGTFSVPRGDDPTDAWTQGKLVFTLHGRKLRGAFTLVRIKGRERSSKPQWLLMKKDDASAEPGWRLELEEPDARFRSEASRPRERSSPPTRVTRTKAKTSKPISAATLRDRHADIEGDANLKVGRTVVPLTSLEKVYWETEGYTKADLLAYYLRVGKLIMPHLKGRPAILKRYPNGTRDEGFFQHDVRTAPDLLQIRQLVSETGRVKLATTKRSVCPGPMWLKGRTRMTAWP